MGRKSIIARLPPDVKTYIEGLLAEGRYTLDEMIATLRERYPARQAAGELPSRAALHRYGPKLERRLIAVKAFSQAMESIDANAGDKADARSSGLMAIVQQELFDSMMMLQDASDPDVDQPERVKLLNDAARSLASLTRSSVQLKEYQAKVRETTRKELLAEQRAKLDDLGKTGAIAPDVLAKVIKAAYDL